MKAKPELVGKVEPVCQNILEVPLGRRVELIVSAMAMHHVEDTAALARTLFDRGDWPAALAARDNAMQVTNDRGRKFFQAAFSAGIAVRLLDKDGGWKYIAAAEELPTRNAPVPDGRMHLAPAVRTADPEIGGAELRLPGVSPRGLPCDLVESPPGAPSGRCSSSPMPR